MPCVLLVTLNIRCNTPDKLQFLVIRLVIFFFTRTASQTGTRFMGHGPLVTGHCMCSMGRGAACVAFLRQVKSARLNLIFSKQKFWSHFGRFASRTCPARHRSSWVRTHGADALLPPAKRDRVGATHADGVALRGGGRVRHDVGLHVLDALARAAGSAVDQNLRRELAREDCALHCHRRDANGAHQTTKAKRVGRAHDGVGCGPPSTHWSRGTFAT